MQRTTSRLLTIGTTTLLAGALAAAPAVAAPGDVDAILTDPAAPGPAVVIQDVADLADGQVPLFCDVFPEAEGDSPIVFSNGGWSASGGTGNEITFGRAGDVPLCGDFGILEDESGAQDTFAVRRGNQFYVSGSPSDDVTARTVISFRFGRATDQALVGDWDGDGVDTIALRRGSAIFFAGDNVDGGGTVTSSVWGRASDVAVAGSYAGQEYDTVALRRGNVFITTASQGGGRLSQSSAFSFGRVSTDLPLAAALVRDEPGQLGVYRVEL